MTIRAAVFAAPLALLLFDAAFAGNSAPPVQNAPPVRFNQDIRPILSDNCFFCHGPDKNKRQANLRLDVRENAVETGVIVPGQPEKSRLISRVFATEPSVQMPPESAHKTLSPAQKNLLRRWVAEGAKYEAHWAYLPLQQPAVPPIKNIAGVKNPIDAFVRQKIIAAQLKPSPEADRRTLIRRVSLDLIGLPPTPAEVEAFVSDKRPEAYEKLVDRLLANSRYGERMAVPWLDAVRYADTVGFHGDQYQNAWAYRDYVIDAFNTNKPFDQFTIEQIAGDLLPNPTPAQQAATCFNRLNMMTREGGAQNKEYLAKYAADRVRTVSMTWLGSTFGCAECHDHKFDPISQKDFYALGAFFADLQQWGVYADYGYTANPELSGYNNDSPFPPEIVVESRYLQQRIQRQRQNLHALIAATQPDPAAFASWKQETADFLAAHPNGWEAPTMTESQKADDDKSADRTWSVRPTAPFIAAIRIELLPQAGSIFRPGVDTGTLTLNARRAPADGKGEAVSVPFRHAAASHHLPRYAGGEEMIGVQDGWALDPATKDRRQVAVFLPETPLRLDKNEELVLTFPNLPAAAVRVSVSPLVPVNPSTTTLPAASSALTPDQYLFGTAWNSEAFAKARQLETDILACRGGKTPVMVTKSVTPLTMRVLPRGNWQDESGPIVLPATPHFLPGKFSSPVAAEKAVRPTRLDLARWLISDQNPLTARVMVNRLWQQFFGVGLSAQVEDLGAQGEWPTHPELLDWLAAEFRKDWNIKRLVRLLVTSATYRQSSAPRADLQKQDPENRLLAHQNARRLDAEFVRDNALAIADLLNTDSGGPPALPYQPAGYYANLQFPDRVYVASTDDRQWRRGIYMHRQRTFLHPMLAAFDAPSREDAVCTRNLANSPQQALALLNDPEFVEAARVLADSLVQQKSATDTVRLNRLFLRALARLPKPSESESLRRFLNQMRAEYKQHPDDAKKLLGVGYAPAPESRSDLLELAAWANVCRVVLNLHETITRY